MTNSATTVKKVDIYHVRGREQPAVDYVDFQPVERDNGDRMCRTPELVEVMNRAGIDATRSWCAPTKEGAPQCPFASNCDWLSQREDVKAANVVVATHDSLYTPIIGNPLFDVIFVDEELRGLMPVRETRLAVGIKAGFTAEIPFTAEILESLVDDEQRNALDNIAELQHQLADIFRTNADNPAGLLQKLRSSKFSRTQAKICAIYLRENKRVLQADVLRQLANTHSNDPNNLTKEGIKYIQRLNNVPYSQIASILELVLLELKNDVDADCTSLYCESRNGEHGIEYYVGGSQWVPPTIATSTAVLHADGTGNEELVRETFGQHVTTTEINVKRNIHATLVKQSNFSSTSLDKYYKGAERKYNEITALTKREQYDAVLTHDKTVRRMNALVDGGVWSEAYEEDIHFMKLRGRNIFEDKNKLAIFSMPLPPVPVVERKARAIALHRGVRFNGIEQVDGQYAGYPSRPVELHTADGRVHKLNVSYHPDPLGELIRYQLCEMEIVQGIDRLRGVNAEHTKEVILFANTAITQVEWNQCIRYVDYEQRGYTRVDATLFSIGVLPLSPRLWVAISDAIIPMIFEGCTAKDTIAQKGMEQWKQTDPKKDYSDLVHGDVVWLGAHPTKVATGEYLVCLDVQRPPQRALRNQHFIVHAHTAEYAVELVQMQVCKIPGHFIG